MARNRLPYYSFFPSDFDTDENVRGMDDAELGFYVRCLNHAWVNGSIPADLRELARIFQRQVKCVERVWGRVGRCFSPKADQPERLVNSRQEEERALASKKSNVAREKVNKRWEKVRQNHCGDTTVSPQHPSGNTHQKQIQNSIPLTAESPVWTAFERCRALHPNCTDPDLALQILMSLVDKGDVTDADAALMEPGMVRWLESQVWSEGQEKFSREWRKFSEWIAGKAWRANPAPTADAKVNRQGGKRSSEGSDPSAEWVPSWKSKEVA